MLKRIAPKPILVPGIFAFVLLLLLASDHTSATPWAQTPPTKTSPSPTTPGDLPARIDAYLRPFVQTNNFTGVVFVSRGDRILFQKGYGLANPNFDIPNTPQTRFHIASISKSFTAAAILLLEERGKLNTSDAVSKFLPDYPNGAKIRLEHLLTHGSGIPNVSDLPELSHDAYVPYTAASIVAAFKDKPLDFEPGSRFRYTNSDYNLLALIVEKVSGQRFGDFLKASIFDPQGLRSTVHDGDATRVIKNLAAGTEPDGLLDVKHLPYLAWSTKTGSGSLVSTTADLCTFARALFGGKLLQPASLAKIMQSDGVFPYGWTDRERFGRKAKAVGGRSPGFISNVEYFLEDGTCVAILTNSYSSVGQVIAPDISAIALGQSATPPPVAYVRPSPGQLAAFTGRFQMPANYYVPNATLTIQDRGDYLESSWPIGLTTVIYPAGGDDFVDRTNWAMVHFNRDAHGQVTNFTYKLLQDFTARKLPAQ
jgi:D-alanyl-D-alanine carboxypeptidase